MWLESLGLDPVVEVQLCAGQTFIAKESVDLTVIAALVPEKQNIISHLFAQKNLQNSWVLCRTGHEGNTLSTGVFGLELKEDKLMEIGLSIIEVDDTLKCWRKVILSPVGNIKK